MAALNFLIGPYARVFALLEAHTPTAGKLKVANEMRADVGKAYPEVLDAKKPADFPRVYLRRPRFDGAMFTGEETTAFAQENAAFNIATDPWEGRFTLTLDGKIVHKDSNDAVNSIFEAEFITALIKGGPKLGLVYVDSWTFNATTIETAKDEAGGTKRQVTTFTIPIKLIITGDELLNS
jgi:hypothetical protein